MSNKMPAVQLTKYHRFNDPYDETSRPTTVDTVFKPASNVTSSQTSSGLENSTRLSSSSNDDHCVMRSPSQLSSTTALPRQADVYRQPTDPEKPVTNDRTPVVASATTMTSAIPPPAPPLPPPAVISASAASVLGSSHVTMTVPRPKLQTKRFQWTKIPVSRAAGGSPTVWTVVGRMLGDSLGPADGGRCSPDFNCLEQLFSVQAASTSGLIGGGASTALFGPGLPPGSGGLLASADGLTLDRRKKPEEILLLDSKRSMNVNIFLRQFGSQVSSIYADIVKWLRDGSSEMLGAERLRNLLKILPDADELQLLAPYAQSNDKMRLGGAERFFLELVSVPRYDLLVEMLLLKEEFPAILDMIKPAVDAIILTARGIKDNTALHKILATVLMAGNFLNSGAYAGEAIGFRLGSLLKLTDIRANKPNMNLMHFVAMEVEKNDAKVVDHLNQLKYLAEASQYSIDILHEDIRSLHHRISRVNEHINLTDSHFQLQIKPFLQLAETEMLTLDADMREMEDLRRELAVYFCEDEESFRLDECLSTFNTFCQKFLKAIEENRERLMLDEQAELRRRHREQQTMRKTRFAHGTPCLSITTSASCDDLSSSCASTPPLGTITQPNLMPSSSLFASKSSYARRQSSPNGCIAIRCDDIDIDDSEVSNALQRGCRRGLSMTSAESAGAINEVAVAADDLVDVLLKESASSPCGGGHLMRAGGSPVIVGSSSPMFRRRRRSGVQLTEPLTVSRERTPSPRLSIFVGADESISGSSTPEPVVESVSSKLTAKTTMTTRCDLEAPHDEQRRRRSADSSLAPRSGSSDNLLASIQRSKDEARLMQRQQSQIEEQKRRDHEARREERRRLSLEANRLLSTDVLQAPSSGQLSNSRQNFVRCVTPGRLSQEICGNFPDQRQATVTSSSLNTTNNSLVKADVTNRSDESDICSSRPPTGGADTSSKLGCHQTASKDVLSSANTKSDAIIDRDDFSSEASRRPSQSHQTDSDNNNPVHSSMLPCDDLGGSQSATCSGGKSLKERFHCLSLMYARADNEDSVEATHSSRVSRSSVAPPSVDLTSTPLSPLSEITNYCKTSSTGNDGVRDEECHDEGFESEHVSTSPGYTSQRNSVSSSTADVTLAADSGYNAGVGEAAASAANNKNDKNEDVSGHSDQHNKCNRDQDDIVLKDATHSDRRTVIPSTSEESRRRIGSEATKCGGSLTGSRIMTQQRQAHRSATVSIAAGQRRGVLKQSIGRTTLKTAVRYSGIIKSSTSVSRQPLTTKSSVAGVKSHRPAKTATAPDAAAKKVPSRRTYNLGVVQSRHHVAAPPASQSVTGSRLTTGQRKSTIQTRLSPTVQSHVNHDTGSGTAKSANHYAASAEPTVTESCDGSRGAESAARHRSSKTQTLKTNFPSDAKPPRRPPTTSAESVGGKTSTRRAATSAPAYRKLSGRPVRSSTKLVDSKVQSASSSDSSVSSADELSQSFVPLEFTDEPSPTVQTIQRTSFNSKVEVLTAKSTSNSMSSVTADHSNNTQK